MLIVRIMKLNDNENKNSWWKIFKCFRVVQIRNIPIKIFKKLLNYGIELILSFLLASLPFCDQQPQEHRSGIHIANNMSRFSAPPVLVVFVEQHMHHCNVSSTFTVSFECNDIPTATHTPICTARTRAGTLDTVNFSSANTQLSILSPCYSMSNTATRRRSSSSTSCPSCLATTTNAAAARYSRTRSAFCRCSSSAPMRTKLTCSTDACRPSCARSSLSPSQCEAKHNIVCLFYAIWNSSAAKRKRKDEQVSRSSISMNGIVTSVLPRSYSPVCQLPRMRIIGWRCRARSSFF